MSKFHVLTEGAGKSLGILDAEGCDQPHTATLAQIAAAAESAHETYEAARDAAQATGGERWVLDESGDSTWIPAGKRSFTYTIFDANPNTSSGTAWDTHTDVEIEAADADAAIEAVREVMSSNTGGLNPSDGYEVGQRLHAIVWDEDTTIVGTPTYTLTAEDLGVETEDTEARLKRAPEHIGATDLGDGRWAHYDDAMSTWYVVTADELAELCDYLDDEDEQVSKDAYSHWCAGTSAEEMSEGWTPDSDAA